jgi:hypothetical protein
MLRIVSDSKDVMSSARLVGISRARIWSRRRKGGWSHAFELWINDDGSERSESAEDYLDVVLQSRGPVVRPQARRFQLLLGGKA